MFERKIQHPYFHELTRGLLGYNGKLNLDGLDQVEIRIKGRSDQSLKYAVVAIQDVADNLERYIFEATESAYKEYLNAKEYIASEDIDLESEGGCCPELKSESEVWGHMKLERIDIEPKELYKVRLSFVSPWEIEHDFGIYISEGKFQFCGTSV